MTRFFWGVFFTFLMSFRLFANEYSIGDVIEKDGVSYKVLVTYLVVDPKESKDTVKGPSSFYCSGELMAIKVDKNLSDVVIPTVVNRFKVIGLSDSLFYGHEHDRIWLPELMFVGSGCFANLKLRSGALVVHDVDYYGYGVFDGLQSDLILDITRVNLFASAFKISEESHGLSYPKGLIKLNSKSLKFVKGFPLYDMCSSAVSTNYQKWIDNAYNGDKEFQNHDIKDKSPMFNKRTYTTTPKASEKRGLMITASAVNVKKMGYPWGNMTREYHRQSKYTVVTKGKRNRAQYQEFYPIADATKKEGWYVKFVGEEGEVKYTLNGKLIK